MEGEKFVIFMRDQKELTIIDANTLKVLDTIPHDAGDDQVEILSFVGNDKVVTSSMNGTSIGGEKINPDTVILYDINTKKELKRLKMFGALVIQRIKLIQDSSRGKIGCVIIEFGKEPKSFNATIFDSSLSKIVKLTDTGSDVYQAADLTILTVKKEFFCTFSLTGRDKKDYTIPNMFIYSIIPEKKWIVRNMYDRKSNTHTVYLTDWENKTLDTIKLKGVDAYYHEAIYLSKIDAIVFTGDDFLFWRPEESVKIGLEPDPNRKRKGKQVSKIYKRVPAIRVRDSSPMVKLLDPKNMLLSDIDGIRVMNDEGKIIRDYRFPITYPNTVTVLKNWIILIPYPAEIVRVDCKTGNRTNITFKDEYPVGSGIAYISKDDNNSETLRTYLSHELTNVVLRFL
jgi:hypothetical protein